MVMKFTLDGLGWTYVGIATFWTIVLLTGIAFLVPKRNLPFLRIRNVPLAVSAVATLHVYWVLCMLAYVLQGFFPCGTEYWIMSIYLPLGIALFQACNTQLLYIANLQQRYVSDYQAEKKEPNTKNPRGWRRYLAHHYVENRVKRTMIYIGYGMCIQVGANWTESWLLLKPTTAGCCSHVLSRVAQVSLILRADRERW